MRQGVWSPRELFAIERLRLKPLQAWIPEHTVCFRARWACRDKRLAALHSLLGSGGLDRVAREAPETRDKIEIQLDARHRHACAVDLLQNRQVSRDD